MAVSIKHKFVSELPEGPDPKHVNASNWNDEHDTTGILDSDVHAAIDHTGITGVPSISGLLNETSHDLLDHTGLTGVHASGSDNQIAFGVPSSASGRISSTNVQSALEQLDLISRTVNSGAVLPASPQNYELFLHAPTGRKWLVMYDGSAWVPIFAFGASTLYLDASGTDSMGYGYGTGANAFKTREGAWALIPPLYSGNITVNTAAGTYTASSVSFYGKYPTGAYTITFVGDTMTDSGQGSLTVASATAGVRTDGTATTITVNSKTWTTDQFMGYFIRMTSGTYNGSRWMIEGNTNAANPVITVAAAFSDDIDASYAATIVAPDANNTFVIETPSTIFDDSGTAPAITVEQAQQAVVFKYITFQTPGATSLMVRGGANVKTYWCKFLDSINIEDYALFTSLATIFTDDNTQAIAIKCGKASVQRSLVYDTGGTAGIKVESVGYLSIYAQATIKGFGDAGDYALHFTGNSSGVGASNRVRINGAHTGIYANYGGNVNFGVQAKYFNIGSANTGADATTFGYAN